MGYQNKDRPTTFEELLLDIKFDLSDLKNDIKRQYNIQELLLAVSFIEETIKLLIVAAGKKDNE
jgi:hypothetical protein